VRRLLELAVATVVLAAAVAYRAWPLPLHIGGRIETGEAWGRADQELIAWILSWGAHALTTAPARLFEANIFHPASDALARSEHLLGLQPIALPVFAITGDPQVTYNATVLLVALVGALGTFVAVRAWSGSSAAGVLAAVLFGLAPMSVAAWNRLHGTAVHLFPLLLWLAWRTAVERRRSAGAWLALATALQLLAGIYVAFELAALYAAFLPLVCLEARHRGSSGVRPLAAVAAGGLALSLVATPYLRVRAAGGLPDYTAVGTGTLDFDPIATIAFFERSFPWPFWILALLGARSRDVPWRLRAGLVSVAALGGVLALGPSAGVYALAQLVVPGFSGMRAPSRFLVLPLASLSVLAGLGIAGLRAWLPRPAVASLALVSAVLVVVLLPVPPFSVVPALRRSRETYDWLRANGEGRAVLEIPVVNDVLDTTRLLDTTGYMLGSTAHWSPLVNGYSGHPPASDRLLMTLAQRLPDPASLADLRALADPGWLVVHRDRLGPDAEGWQSAHARLGLDAPIEIGPDAIYRLPGPAGSLRAELLAQLSDPGAKRTLRGLPQEPLSEGAALASLAGDLPDTLTADRFVWFWLRVRNDGAEPWPGIALREDGAVGLQVRWLDPESGALVKQASWYPLARDLAPGESVRAQAGSWVPAPGEYILELGVVQPGVGWFADTGGRGAISHRVTVTAAPPPRAGERS
jgi:hypothetical protein